jgi:DnaD/phage-associated family protein
MAWIESHQTLRQHPKLAKAARYLGISKVQLIGHLHCLWWWALDYAQDGDLSAYDNNDIAAAAEWEKDSDDFVHALTDIAKIGDKTGFLEYEDGRLHIHDWWDYAGKLISKREKDAERKRTDRSKDKDRKDKGTSEDVQRTSNGHPEDVAGTNQPTNQPYQPTNNGDDDDSCALSPDLARVSETYQNNIGLMTMIISDSLKDDINEYGADWVVEAIQTATKAEQRKLSYVEGILKNWKRDGKNGHRNGNGKDVAAAKVNWI